MIYPSRANYHDSHMKWRVVMLLMLSALPPVEHALRAERWLRLTSKQGRFQVCYPPSWYPLQHPGGLDIINFPPGQRVRGVVLKEGGAEIAVLRQRDDNVTLEQWIRQDLQNSEADVWRDGVRDHNSERTSDCHRLIEVRWEWAAGPGGTLHEVGYYCSAKGGIYRVRLTFWADDPDAGALNTTVLRVVQSLRVW